MGFKFYLLIFYESENLYKPFFVIMRKTGRTRGKSAAYFRCIR